MSRIKRTEKNLKLATSAAKKVFKIMDVREMAKKLDITTQTVHKWKKSGVSKDYVLEVAKLINNQVTIQEMWPELKEFEKYLNGDK